MSQDDKDKWIRENATALLDKLEGNAAAAEAFFDKLIIKKAEITQAAKELLAILNFWRESAVAEPPFTPDIANMPEGLITREELSPDGRLHGATPLNHCESPERSSTSRGTWSRPDLEEVEYGMAALRAAEPKTVSQQLRKRGSRLQNTDNVIPERPQPPENDADNGDIDVNGEKQVSESDVVECEVITEPEGNKVSRSIQTLPEPRPSPTAPWRRPLMTWEKELLDGWQEDNSTLAAPHRCQFGGITCTCCDSEKRRWASHKQQHKRLAGSTSIGSCRVHGGSGFDSLEVREPPSTLVARPFGCTPVRPPRHAHERHKYEKHEDVSKWGASRLSTVVRFDSAAFGGTSHGGVGKFGLKRR